MKKILIIIILIVILPWNGLSKAGLPTADTSKILTQVSELLIEKKYDQAKDRFQELPLEEKQKNWNFSRKTLAETFDLILDILILIENREIFFNNVESNLDKFEFSNRTIKERNCMDCEEFKVSSHLLEGKQLPANGYFGHELDVNLETRIKKATGGVIEVLKKLQLNDARRYDDIVKQKGYIKYSGIPILSLMYRVQQQGGLENHINSVFGCPGLKSEVCRKNNKKIKILQITDKIILWSFYVRYRRKPFTFTIATIKEPNVKDFIHNAIRQNTAG
jgi:hypothetical protein